MSTSGSNKKWPNHKNTKSCSIAYFVLLIHIRTYPCEL